MLDSYVLQALHVSILSVHVVCQLYKAKPPQCQAVSEVGVHFKSDEI